jgi:hypothetical protein
MVMIREFFNTEKDSEKERFDFDVPNDVYQFMINDPVFYRRTYYPKVSNMCSRYNKGKEIDHKKELTPVILNACARYVETYKLNADAGSLLDDSELESVANKIFTTETGCAL